MSPSPAEGGQVDDRRRDAVGDVETFILAHPRYFPLAASRSHRSLRATIRSESARIRSIANALAAEYGSPDLGNKQDPVAEIVYIALSRRTREAAYQAAYAALVARFATWDCVADASEEEIAAVIAMGGLGQRKARSIRESLRVLRERFGSCTVDVAGWSDEEVERFLVGLPEVGHKSAACIMAMSLDRAAFAVDVHVGRVLARVAPYPRLGLDLEPLGHKTRQALLPPLVPPELRRDLHVNLVVHGRQMCRYSRPRCVDCPIRRDCSYGSAQDGAHSSP